MANVMYNEADVDIHNSHTVLSDQVLFCDDEQVGVFLVILIENCIVIVCHLLYYN